MVRSVLPAAVQAYFIDQTGGAVISKGDLDLVRLYLQQWIEAPCWTCAPDMAAELAALRRDVMIIETADGMHDWLMRALDLGIDPF
jgi:hypothetical protein